MDQALDVTRDGSSPPLIYAKRREGRANGAAAWHTVPQRAIVSVEHPCIIKNIDKGLRTLGADTYIHKLLETDKERRSLSLYLRPDDTLSKPLYSRNIETNNLLIKVTVPKRTGRKRKRGSDEPYVGDADVSMRNTSTEDGEIIGSNCATSKFHSTPKDTAYLLQSLRDNVDKYKVEPVGIIEQTHRFRGLPDFQHSTTRAPFMNKMRDFILPYDYKCMKEFKFDPSKGLRLNDEVIPPPIFTRLYTPLNYGYNQNPAVKTAVGTTGMPVTGNTQPAPVIFTHLVTYDTESVPSEPDPNLIPYEILDPALQIVIEQVRDLFNRRPIWTRRALSNSLVDQRYEYYLKFAFQYVGYMFRSGPWNNAIVKFGVDPRKDPKYRFYQSLMFQVKTKDRGITVNRWEDGRARYKRKSMGKQKDVNSHLFNGRTVSLDGKTWQICDITDPLLKDSMYTDNIRTKCDIQGDGWYHNGTLAKVKTVIKAKMKMMIEGRTPSDAEFVSVMNLPEIIDDTTRPQAILDKKQVSMQEVRWATYVRTVMKKAAPRTEPGRDFVIDGQTIPQQDNNSEDIVQGEANQALLVDTRVTEAMHQLKQNDQREHPIYAAGQNENFAERYQISDHGDNEIEIESGVDSDDDDDDDDEDTEDEGEESDGDPSGDEDKNSDEDENTDEDENSDEDISRGEGRSSDEDDSVGEDQDELS